MKTILILAACSIALLSCGRSRNRAAAAAPLTNAWAAVALKVEGPESNADKAAACVEEAHRFGVNIDADAPSSATLYLGGDGNRVTLASGNRSFGKISMRALCRLSLAYALELDKRVKVNKTEPTGCEELGAVQGEDQGYAFFGVNPGSYEAALAAIQFSANERGANYVVIDVAREVGMNFSISGRAFKCATGLVVQQQQQPETGPAPSGGATTTF